MNKSPIQKLSAAVVAFAVCLFALSAQAQTYQFSQPTYLTTPTNSPVLATTIFGVSIPPISLTITATNNQTRVTNTICQVIQYTNSFTFVYDASTMGTNFSTNFNNGQPLFMQVTNQTFGLATPQSGGSNTCFIK